MNLYVLPGGAGGDIPSIAADAPPRPLDEFGIAGIGTALRNPKGRRTADAGAQPGHASWAFGCASEAQSGTPPPAARLTPPRIC